MDLRLELVTVPVSNIDRAIAFYAEQVGFSVEQDVQVDDAHRFVELVPLARSARSLCRRVMWIRYQGRLQVCNSTSTTSTRCTRSYGDRASPCRTCRTIRGGDSASSPTPTVTTGRTTAHCLPSRAALTQQMTKTSWVGSPGVSRRVWLCSVVFVW